MKRIIWFIVGIVSALFFSWWLTLIILLFGFFSFPRYYEGLAIGLIYDGLYFAGQGSYDIPVWFFGSLLLFLLIYYIKPALR